MAILPSKELEYEPQGKAPCMTLIPNSVFPDPCSAALFEIEYSTDFKNSLLKFLELQDFNVDFRVVADKKRESQ